MGTSRLKIHEHRFMDLSDICFKITKLVTRGGEKIVRMAPPPPKKNKKQDHLDESKRKIRSKAPWYTSCQGWEYVGSCRAPTWTWTWQADQLLCGVCADPLTPKPTPSSSSFPSASYSSSSPVGCKTLKSTPTSLPKQKTPTKRKTHSQNAKNTPKHTHTHMKNTRTSTRSQFVIFVPILSKWKSVFFTSTLTVPHFQAVPRYP